MTGRSENLGQFSDRAFREWPHFFDPPVGGIRILLRANKKTLDIAVTRWDTSSLYGRESPCDRWEVCTGMELSAVDDRLLTDLDDESLAFGAAEDFEAFAELYRRHECVIYKSIRAKTPSDDIAEDLTAQVFFKALSSAKTWRGEGSYRSWLYAIAQNSISSYLKSRQRVAAVEVVPEPVDPTPDPGSQVIVGEARNLVWKRVSELPDAQKEAVVLRYLKELSIEEVARLTRRTRGAVRILLHRARMKLRESMEDHKA